MDENEKKEFTNVSEADEAARQEFLSEEAEAPDNSLSESSETENAATAADEATVASPVQTTAPEAQEQGENPNVREYQLVSDNKRLSEENAQLKAQLSRMTQAQQNVQEINSEREASLIENMSEDEALKKFNDEFFDDSAGAVKNLVDSMVAKRVDSLIKDKLGGIMSEYNESKAAQEWDNAFRIVASSDSYADAGEMKSVIQDIIRRNPEWMKSSNKAQAIINGYLIAKGLSQRNSPTIEERINDDAFIDTLMSNPEVMKKITAKQAKLLEENKNIPPFSASGGLSGAQPHIYKEPTNLDEADALARKVYGNI